MTGTVPVQAFQIGQRVRPRGREPFVIRTVFYSGDGTLMYGNGRGSESLGGWSATTLTLAPERPPYVPSERMVVGRLDASPRFASADTERYRCETDAELAARHAIERAEYDRLCPADPVIYNARGESIGITGRTSLDGPGAA